MAFIDADHRVSSDALAQLRWRMKKKAPTKAAKTVKEKQPRRIEVAPQKGWEVIDSGRKGAARVRAFPSREAAIAEAAKLAGANRPSELVIRRSDGSIQIERSLPNA